MLRVLASRSPPNPARSRTLKRLVLVGVEKVVLFLFSLAARQAELGRKMEEDGFAHRLCLLIPQLRGKWQGGSGLA